MTTSTPRTAQQSWSVHPVSRLRARLRGLILGDDPRPAALGYLLYLTLAELLTTYLVVQIGVLLHLLGLFLLIVHTAIVRPGAQRRFLFTLALVPLIRIVSMSLPLVGFDLVYWYLITSVPLFAAAIVVMQQLGYNWRDVGLHARGWGWLWEILIGLSGLFLGYIEYLILRPAPLVESFTLQQLWLPALILLISTGYLEELIFRRIMQRTAVEHLGRWRGIIYVAIFFAVLHIGYKSLIDVLFVFVVGLLFGLVVARTRNLLGVTLAHGLTNIMLFLVMPFWAAGALPLPAPPLPELTFELQLWPADKSPDILAPTATTAPTQPAAVDESVPTNTPQATPTETRRPTRTPISILPGGVMRATASHTPESTSDHTPEPTPGLSAPPPTATALPPSATPAVTATQCGPPAGWVTYTVHRGENLFRIGLRVGASVSQLQLANCLTSTNVYVGQVLYVPVPLAAPTLQSQPSQTPQPQPTTETESRPESWPTATTEPPQPTVPPPPTNEPPPTTTPPLPPGEPPPATATAAPPEPPPPTPTAPAPGDNILPDPIDH